MKKFFLFVFITAAFSLTCLFLTEKTGALGLHHPTLNPRFIEEDGKQTLVWDPVFYPCYYRVETFRPATGIIDGEKSRLIKSSTTIKPRYELDTSAIANTYRITVYGIFGPLAETREPILNPHFAQPTAPTLISHYTEAKPASLRPYLLWHTVPKAVCYELELLSQPPLVEGGTTLDPRGHLYSTQRIYTNGCQLDLTPWKDQPQLYWRVRGLDIGKQPVGEFSRSTSITIDAALPPPDAPILNNYDAMPGAAMPLYPVYHWIPIYNDPNKPELRYEIELLLEKPSNENGTIPSTHPIWRKLGDDLINCYDESSRANPGRYYWRVRAVDRDGQTVGHYSDTASFEVQDYGNRPFAAAYGDSITHGGGAVSYSPANLEYSYTTYLDFPAINLGRSGDTTAGSLERFNNDVLPIAPYNLLILTGANNLRDSTPAEQVIADLMELERRCLENDIRPVFMTLIPLHPDNIMRAFGSATDRHWFEKMQKINAFIRTRTYCIDLEPYFYDNTKRLLDEQFAIDGLHPDVKGKMLMAEIVNAHQSILRK